MLSRRDLLSAGVAGSLAGNAEHGAGRAEDGTQKPRANPDELEDIVVSVDKVATEIAHMSSVTTGPVAKLRAYMETFARSNQKFPDYMEVGVGIFYAMYDWHVKNRQPLVIVRQQDGRYHLQFMFTNLILRLDFDPGFIGQPYDKA